MGTFDKTAILVVDDQEEILTLIKLKLEGAGFSEVYTASSGDEAYSILRSQQIGLLIVDQNLGDGSLTGLDLSELAPDTRTIVISGAELCDGDLAAVGASKFLLKPFDVDELVEVARANIA